MLNRILLAMLLSLAGISLAYAQSNYPSRPIRWIIPFPPGGGADMIARPIAAKLGEALGQQIVYENRGGGGGLIAAEAVARSAPDGYTLLVASTNTHVFGSLLYDKIAYDPVKDFAPITQFDSTPNVLVGHANFPARNIPELIAHAKAHPGKINWASSGNGTGTHLAIILLSQEAGIKVLHIPYKGAGPATTALLSGESDLEFANTGVVMPHIKSGKFRALGFAGLKRLGTLPEVATFNESGFPGFEASEFKGLMAPAGTPQVIINRLHAELVKIVMSPESVARLEASGSMAVANTPAQFAEYLKREVAKWGKIIKDNNIKAD